MNEQRVRAREARKDVSGWSTDSIDLTALAPTEFTGYQTLEQEASVLAIVRDGSFADSVEEGQQATIILNKTSFYGESGGQVGDTGVIVSGENVFAVQDTKKDHEGHFMHIGVVQKGSFNSGDAVTARVDELRRRRIMSNHSVCHLLQLALREVLGTHVHQAGSYYDEHRCRFDFSHFSAMTKEEIQQVQDKVNRMILEGHPVQIEEPRPRTRARWRCSARSMATSSASAPWATRSSSAAAPTSPTLPRSAWSRSSPSPR